MANNGTGSYKYTNITENCQHGTLTYDIREIIGTSKCEVRCYKVSVTADNGWTWTWTTIKASHGSSSYTWGVNQQYWNGNNYLSAVKIDSGEEIDIVINVTFTKVIPQTYHVTVIANPETGGYVDGGGDYEDGATCTISASANTGYRFLKWTGLTTVKKASYSFEVHENSTWTAYFHRNTGLILRHKNSGIILISNNNVILRDGNP